MHNVNEKSESETSRITHLIIDGKFDLSRAENIVVGNVLANNLGIIVGDRIKLANYDKTFKKVNLLVTGIFDSGIHEYNQRYVFGSDMALTDKTNYEYIKLKLYCLIVCIAGCPRYSLISPMAVSGSKCSFCFKINVAKIVGARPKPFLLIHMIFLLFFKHFSICSCII